MTLVSLWAFGLTSWLFFTWISKDAAIAAIGMVVTLIGAGVAISLLTLVVTA